MPIYPVHPVYQPGFMPNCNPIPMRYQKYTRDNQDFEHVLVIKAEGDMDIGQGFRSQNDSKYHCRHAGLVLSAPVRTGRIALLRHVAPNSSGPSRHPQ